MTALSIKFEPVLSGGHFKEPIHIRNTKEVHGVLFWKAAKSDHVVTRMVFGKSETQQRPLSKTNVLETMQHNRNKAVESMIKALGGPKEDLGLDDIEDSVKINKTDLDKLQSIIYIDAPNIGPVEGMKVRVLKGKSTKPLWLELSITVVEYLHKACSYQLSQEPVLRNRPHHKDVAGDPGVSWEDRRKAFRARRENGKVKYFLVKNYEVDDDARNAAIEWVAGGLGDEEDLPCLQDGPANLEASDECIAQPIAVS